MGKRGDAIAGIRDHYRAFGYDLSDCTDEEIEESMVKMGELITGTGLTCTQAADALAQLGNAYTKGD